MKTLRTFSNLIPAQLAQARLLASGIQSVIPEEASASMGYAGVVGGVRIQVRAEDVTAAETILAEETDFFA